MTEYIVGLRLGKRSEVLTIEAEDALIAALKAKYNHPEALISYVRKSNRRGRSSQSASEGMKITKRADQCPLVALRVISLQSSFGRFPRWHQTLKNRILLDNYYLPGDDPHCAGGWLVSPGLTGRSFIPKR